MPTKPTMQRRHYELIAATIHTMTFDNRWQSEQEMREAIAGQFALALRATNPNFDADRFMAAATTNRP